MGGAIIARSELITRMRKDIVSMGPTLDPHAAFLIQRGMRTYFLRYERQCSNALAVSSFLKDHSRVRKVFYPGLDGHPQHLLARRQMSDFGTVVIRGPGLRRHCGCFRCRRAWDRPSPW
jgi:cystathionine beta-lyase/cystathionine gamma-synthase